MYEYRVGTLYNKNRTRWPQAVEYNYRANTHELRMFLAHLAKPEIEQIASGPCRFALAVEGDVIFLLSDFGKPSPWSDSPYTIHMVPAHEQTEPPELRASERALLTIVLVSAEDGIIRALRTLSLGHDFSNALHTAIREQMGKPFDQARYDRQLANAYQRYPTTQVLLKRVKVTCIIQSGNEN